MSYLTFLARSFPGAPVLASRTQGLCILTAPMSVALPPRLISLKRRYAKPCSAFPCAAS